MDTMVKSHQTATREEWLKARRALLQAEKELTRKSDEVARRREALPWVKVENDYRFQTCSGQQRLIDLFHGRSQLLVYHLMFGPDYERPCPSCSSIADGFDGIWPHLANHDVMLVAISRAPFQKIAAYKEKRGWTFPWVSSFGSDFNYEYCAGLTSEQQDGGYTYNYEKKPPLPSEMGQMEHAAMAGVDSRTFLKELPGMSAFVLEDGEVYHTYSAYARGLDGLWGMYQWLDRAPLGRNEANGPWWTHREDYPAIV